MPIRPEKLIEFEKLMNGIFPDRKAGAIPAFDYYESIAILAGDDGRDACANIFTQIANHIHSIDERIEADEKSPSVVLQEVLDAMAFAEHSDDDFDKNANDISMMEIINRKQDDYYLHYAFAACLELYWDGMDDPDTRDYFNVIALQHLNEMQEEIKIEQIAIMRPQRPITIQKPGLN